MPEPSSAKAMLEVTPVKAFTDNYLWVFHRKGDTAACVVDPGDAAPVEAYLREAGLRLAAIFITHHHADHIGGVNALLRNAQVPVYGPDTPRIPMVTHPVREGSRIELFGATFRVLEVPGHTLEHIAYYTPEPVTGEGPVLFCGDTLFAAGCGRMFEGTPPMMHASLDKLAALSPDTRVYCAHEYTLANLKFAGAVMPGSDSLRARVRADSLSRERGLPTLPSTMALELDTNPFLRCTQPEVVAAAAAHDGVESPDAARVFGILRHWKDTF